MTHTDKTTLGYALRGAWALGLLVGTATPVWAANPVGLGAIQQAARATEVVAGGVELASTAVGYDDLAQIADMVGTSAAVIDTVAVGTVIATGSGATIMHTVAVTGGPVTMAASAGLGAAKLMNETLYSNCDNPSACDAAQYGTYGGAVVGTAASVATVAAVGAGPVGLAALGGVIGGGMVAGVATLVVAPVVAAAILGGAVYWLFSD